jgi:hypothetical protein
LIVGLVTLIVVLDVWDSKVAAPVEVARAFVEARDAWDAEATVILFASDAVISDLQVPFVTDYEKQYRWYEAVDWRWAVDECAEVVYPARTVTCSYTMNNAWSRALEVGPITGGFDFTVADGQILELTHFFNLGGFDPVWGAFRKWVRDKHPEDIMGMYMVSDLRWTPHYTPESMALWEQYTDEFVASVTNS